MSPSRRTFCKGFSLVELSIVLVILGLLVGGILGGQSLIRAAELRSVVTEKDKFVVATNAFLGKYNGLPGDLTNATAYWGAANADNGTCLATARSGTLTCNGNGNGSIGAINSGTAESQMAWEHLSLSGLIEGKYVGFIAGLNNSSLTVMPGDVNPRAKIKGAYWAYMSTDSNGNAVNYGGWTKRYNHQLLLANYAGVTNEFSGTGSLPPEDAYGVDAKIDDGKPGTGSVTTQNYATTAGQCTDSVTASAGSTAVYALASSLTACKLQFDLGF